MGLKYWKEILLRYFKLNIFIIHSKIDQNLILNKNETLTKNGTEVKILLSRSNMMNFPGIELQLTWI